MTKSIQARLDKLEALYSEQDHTIHMLNDMVVQQGKEISRLGVHIEQIRDQFQSLKTESASEEGSDFEIPPHY